MSNYDDFAEAYASAKTASIPDRYAFYPRLYEAVGDVRGKDVLDLATGAGTIAIEMAASGARSVVAVDDSQAMLQIARQRSSYAIDFQQGCVGEMGAIGQFDVVTAGFLLHYACDKSALVRMCSDIRANLRPDGVFVALNGNPACPLGGAVEYGYTITAASERPNEGDVLTVTVLGNGAASTFSNYYWALDTYRDAMREVGLTLEFLTPEPTEDGVRAMGEQYWLKLRAHPTTAIFRARL